jgi:hypothetical protein
VANKVAAELEKFGKDRLKHEGAEKLRSYVDKTCALLSKHGVDTIDALAKVLRDTNPIAIKEAKIAMSVFFFALEDDAVKRAVPNYAAFFDELFQYGKSPSPSLEERIKGTPCRVLTYNYDRLFELTFIEWVKLEEPGNEKITEKLNTFLNMGLGTGYDVEIKPDQFSLLKLHGGVGQSNRDAARAFGSKSHLYWPKFGQPIPPLEDKYYPRKGYESDEPTIIFSHEKQSGDESSFQGYDSKVWKQAREFCKDASEIQIIGYSIQPIDRFWFKSLLREAKNCTRIILRNQLSEKERLESRLRGIEEEFGAKWEIEYRAEDFFGSP